MTTRRSSESHLSYPKLIFWISIILGFGTARFFRSGFRMKESNKVRQFPDEFMWGTATASFQIEGGVEDRGKSIWDVFCDTPGRVFEGHTGAVAIDHYNQYKSDVGLLADLGAPHYRFSISWPRIFPKDGELSEKGVQFYRSLVSELLDKGITPVATLYHWDLPVWVVEKTGGWAGDGMVADEFAKYARAVFDALGDSITWWITLNEPWCSAVLGYETGEHAPGDTDAPGDKVYKAAHHLLRAHAKAVQVYRDEFKDVQKGRIGITLNADWAEPKGRDEAVAAAERDMDFGLGWFADPVYMGDYPKSMREEIGDRLPEFTEEEKSLLKGSSDFFGLNHYSTHYTTGLWESGPDTPQKHWHDKRTLETRDEKWKDTDMGWAIVPRGFGQLLRHIQNKYAPEGGIIVTENGLAVKDDDLDVVRKDESRISYYERYIASMHEAIQDGVDCRGYFLWSAFDNFEWAFGYSKRFGLFHVDYQTLKRTPKPAVEWYKNVVKNNAVVGDWNDELMGLPRK